MAKGFNLQDLHAGFEYLQQPSETTYVVRPPTCALFNSCLAGTAEVLRHQCTSSVVTLLLRPSTFEPTARKFCTDVGVAFAHYVTHAPVNFCVCYLHVKYNASLKSE